MKLRSDFVTNSSSSSFIIAFKEPEFDKEILDKYPYLTLFPKMIEAALMTKGDSWSETNEGDLYKTAEEFNNYIIEEYGDGKTIESIFDSWCEKDWYERIIDYLNRGYKVLDKRVDYSDDYVESMVVSMSKVAPEYVVILDRE